MGNEMCVIQYITFCVFCIFNAVFFFLFHRKGLRAGNLADIPIQHDLQWIQAAITSAGTSGFEGEAGKAPREKPCQGWGKKLTGFSTFTLALVTISWCLLIDVDWFLLYVYIHCIYIWLEVSSNRIVLFVLFYLLC